MSERELIEKMSEMGISLNGYAMRYYDDNSYRIGVFTNPDPTVRRAAIDLTRRGLDSLAAAGGTLMTLWMGQDGFDYSFQADYMALWEYTIEAIREVADHNPAIDVSIEYKPNEPRSFSVMPDVATTLLAIQEIDRPNLGVTLDFAHVLYADEDAGMCGRIGCASLAIARRPPQRRIREARRWTDGRVGPSEFRRSSCSIRSNEWAMAGRSISTRSPTRPGSIRSRNAPRTSTLSRRCAVSLSG